jgi:hypothetical protein
MHYAYSLRIWLTGRKSKASFILDDNGFRIGSEVKAKIQKSRFGTQGRQCAFKILWGADVGVQDEESWFDAVKSSKHLTSSGAWYSMDMGDGSVVKFQPSRWMEKMQDSKFRERVLTIIDEEVIMKFDKREGDASEFYKDLDDEESSEGTS